MADFPGKGKVAVMKTTPETVLEDYGRLLRLANYQDVLPKEKDQPFHVPVLVLMDFVGKRFRLVLPIEPQSVGASSA